MGVPQNGWFIFIMENPIKMEDWGVPLFLETPKCFRSFMENPSNGQQAAPQREVSPRPVDFGNHASPHRQFEISSLIRPWKLGPPGKGNFYWKPPFLGAMLVFGSVSPDDFHQVPLWSYWSYRSIRKKATFRHPKKRCPHMSIQRGARRCSCPRFSAAKPQKKNLKTSLSIQTKKWRTVHVPF